MIGDGEKYLVVLSLVIPHAYSLGYPNHVSFLNGMLLGALLGLRFGYEVVRYCCSCCHLAHFLKATYRRVDIFCAPIYEAFITYNIHSVRYFQLLEFRILLLPLTLLVPCFGGRWISDELNSNGTNHFTLGMDEDSYRLTYELSWWIILMSRLVWWYFLSLGVSDDLLC